MVCPCLLYTSSGYQAFMHGGDSHYMGYNWHKDILNAWTSENRNTNIPRVDAIDKYTKSSSDRWLTSSDYLSIILNKDDITIITKGS